MSYLWIPVAAGLAVFLAVAVFRRSKRRRRPPARPEAHAFVCRRCSEADCICERTDT